MSGRQGHAELETNDEGLVKRMRAKVIKKKNLGLWKEDCEVE
jgi:hypothetical protein